MSYSPAILRKIGLIVGLTVTEIGIVGAAIYALIPWPYVAAVGFAAYFMIGLAVMILYMVRVSRFMQETNVDDIHTIVCETNQRVTEITEYVKRNA
jgi:hypothetical protein